MEPPASANLTAALEVDCRGLLCPLPILRIRRALDGLAPGALLRMVATDPGSVPDMAAFSRQTGNEILEQSERDGEFVFVVRRV